MSWLQKHKEKKEEEAYDTSLSKWQFVSRQYAKAHPKTTVKESGPHHPKGKK